MRQDLRDLGRYSSRRKSRDISFLTQHILMHRPRPKTFQPLQDREKHPWASSVCGYGDAHHRSAPDDFESSFPKKFRDISNSVIALVCPAEAEEDDQTTNEI